jgi:hypothetical protein
MTDRPASWRMPTPKQMEKLAAATGRRTCWTNPVGPADEMPPEYWQAVLNDASAITRRTGRPIQKQRLCDIQQHVLRVSCRRCDRIVEIQMVDAVRLCGGDAIWKQVGQRLLDNTCQQRTGRLEDDGCWPSFDMT